MNMTVTQDKRVICGGKDDGSLYSIVVVVMVVASL